MILVFGQFFTFSLYMAFETNTITKCLLVSAGFSIPTMHGLSHFLTKLGLQSDRCVSVSLSMAGVYSLTWWKEPPSDQHWQIFVRLDNKTSVNVTASLVKLFDQHLIHNYTSITTSLSNVLRLIHKSSPYFLLKRVIFNNTTQNGADSAIVIAPRTFACDII
jgi:hypothetical protein